LPPLARADWRTHCRRQRITVRSEQIKNMYVNAPGKARPAPRFRSVPDMRRHAPPETAAGLSGDFFGVDGTGVHMGVAAARFLEEADGGRLELGIVDPRPEQHGAG